MTSLDVNENYAFKDGIAYTEDKIPVHKLLVRMIYCKTKDEKVLAYFSQFGEVVKMCMKPKRKRKLNNDSKSVTIHYADARVAAKVLLTPAHILEQPILVSACHSWEQPGAFKPNDDEEIEATAQNSDDLDACVGATTAQAAPPLKILDLDDDCLEHVAKFLKLDEQVRMARTCTRFSGAVEMRARVQYQEIRLEKFHDMTLWEIREFFLMAGPIVKKIVGELPPMYKEQVVELIADNCPHLRGLYLLHLHKLFVDYRISLNRLIVNLNNITELHLHDSLLTDTAMLAIQNLSKLEELSLAENTELTGKYLYKLTTVRKLSLNCCSNIETENFVDIVKSMKDLEFLDIRGCQLLTAKAFEEMQKYCDNLLVLKISRIPITCYGYVARLPSMNHLDLTYGGEMKNDSLFTLLAEHKSTQLKRFMITTQNSINLMRAERIAQLSQLKSLIFGGIDYLDDNCLYQFEKLEQLEDITLSNCVHFTNRGLLHLMRQCTKLRTVNIQYCTQINNDFIFDVIELLEKRKQRLPQNPGKKPVTFHVFNTDIIEESIIEDARFKNASALVNLSFYWRSSKSDIYEHCLNEEEFGNIF